MSEHTLKDRVEKELTDAMGQSAIGLRRAVDGASAQGLQNVSDAERWDMVHEFMNAVWEVTTMIASEVDDLRAGR